MFYLFFKASDIRSTTIAATSPVLVPEDINDIITIVKGMQNKSKKKKKKKMKSKAMLLKAKLLALAKQTNHGNNIDGLGIMFVLSVSLLVIK